MIYICIPTHNEQQTVGVVLWKLRQVLTDYPRDYQLLVADDASTDKTPEVLEPYTRVLPLTVIRSERQLGQAATLELLLREAVRRSEYPKRDIVVTLQADFSEEPDDVVPMIKRIEAGADVAVGNKVSVTKPHWKWRLARRLGSMFAAGQTWPEGVVSPFDGYRAYRLYGLKRAMEDRGGRRLLRYDGWACAAELLRAVLPHVRRIDVLDVEDRPDRLQRPRRERPFASALQIRPMMREVEPPDLIPVEELDRVAATASRSRDRATTAAGARQSGQRSSGSGNGARPNGAGRGRSGTAADRPRREGRPRAERGEAPAASERGAAARSRQPRAARTENQPERPARTRAAPATEGRPGGEERPPRQQRPRKAAPVAKPADVAGGEPVPHGDVLDPVLPTSGPEPAAAEGAAPKKRRRRGRRGGGGGRTAGQPGDDTVAVSAGVETTGETEDERETGVEGTSETGERKRRRRGGRRGGRGRRRGSATAQAESGQTAEGEAGEPPSSEAPAPPAETREDD